MYKSKADKTAHNRNYYQENKKAHLARNKATKLRLREMVKRAKEKPCADCKKEYPYYVMDLDHLHSKVMELNKLIQWGSERRVVEELAKCEAVCANCHRERTHHRSGVAQSEEH